MSIFRHLLTATASSVAAVVGYRYLERKMDEEVLDGLAILHNQTHAVEWGVDYETFMQRFKAICIYVKANVRETTNHITKHPLISQLVMLDDQDIAMLLASGIVRTHDFIEYAKVFGDHDMLFDAFNFRYVTNQQFIDNELDIFVVKYQPEVLKTLAEEQRVAMKKHQNHHVSGEVRKHRASILNLLETAREFSK